MSDYDPYDPFNQPTDFDLAEEALEKERTKHYRKKLLQDAREYLEEFEEYEWLLDGPAIKNWWTTSEVAAAQNVPERTVRSWCLAGKIKGAQNHGKKAGWRMPRTGLILFFGSFENEAIPEQPTIPETDDDDDEDEE